MKLKITPTTTKVKASDTQEGFIYSDSAGGLFLRVGLCPALEGLKSADKYYQNNIPFINLGHSSEKSRWEVPVAIIHPSCELAIVGEAIIST